MKKVALLALTIILFFSISACGGGGDNAEIPDSSTKTEDADSDKTEDTNSDIKEDTEKDHKETFLFVNLAVPEGWRAVVYEEDNTLQINENDGSRAIKFSKEPGTALEARDENIEFNKEKSSPREILGEKTFGNYTYMALGFEWTYAQSLLLYMDSPISNGEYIEIFCVKMAADDPMVAEILNTVTFQAEAK